MTQSPTTAKDREVNRRRPTAVLTTLLFVVVVGAAVLILIQRGDDTAGSASSTSDAVSVQVATGFVEAYRRFDAEGAGSYLAPDAELSGMDGGQEQWRAAIEWQKAHGFELTPEPCEAGATLSTGTIVHCPFAYQGIHSGELGLGPYKGSLFEIVVLDGEIRKALMLFEFRVNGFSEQVWEPFAQWLTENYPDDAAVMYTDASHDYESLTDESIRLWGLRAREYADQAKQG